MAKLSERLYWRTNKSWYGFDPSVNDFYLTDDAPERAKKSFELWQNERSDNETSNDEAKAMRKRIRTFSVMRTCR